jgi:hypothetical protein
MGGAVMPDGARQHFEGGGHLDNKNAMHHAAQVLQSKGRNGDTILAHINPQEAAMLKQMGGSGK